jgi:hypothetical protein
MNTPVPVGTPPAARQLRTWCAVQVQATPSFTPIGVSSEWHQHGVVRTIISPDARVPNGPAGLFLASIQCVAAKLPQ